MDEQLINYKELNNKKKFTFFSLTISEIIVWILIVCLSIILHQKNFLLFHFVVENLTLIVLLSISIFTFKVSFLHQHRFFNIIGSAYVFVAILNALHTYTYKGVGIFNIGNSANYATQFWIAFKFVDLLAGLGSIVFYNKYFITSKKSFIFFGILTTLIIILIFNNLFPVCYNDYTKTLTPFKIFAEISFIFAYILIFFYVAFDKKINSYLPKTIITPFLNSIVAKIISSMFFSIYQDVYGLINTLGHCFHLLSFYLIFKSIIEVNLKQPYDSMFFSLLKSNQLLSESEQKLRSIFENIGNPLLICSVIKDNGKVTDFIVEDINCAFENIFNIKKSDVVNKPISNITSNCLGCQSGYLFEMMNLCISSNETLREEHFCHHLKRWFLVYNFCFDNYVILLFNDITYQKELEISLAESQNFLKTVFNTIPYSIAIINFDGLVMSVNKAWKINNYFNKLFKIECNVSDNFFEICDRLKEKDDFFYQFKFLVNKLLNDKMPSSNIDVEYKGDNIELKIMMHKFKDDNKFLIIIEDITKTKQLENSFRKLNKAFLNFETDFDKNIKLLTITCGEILKLTTMYNVIENDKIKTIAGYNLPLDFKYIDDAKGHICTDVVNKANEGEISICYIPNLKETKYFETDINVSTYNLSTYIGKPVFCHGKCIGTLCVVSTDNLEYDEFKVYMLEIIATAIGIEEERKKEQEKLRQLSLAVEQSASSIVITDLDAKILYVNPKFTEVTGYTLDEAIGQNPRILKSGEMSKEEYEKMWKTLKSGNEWVGEFHNKRKNGELFWELATISPLKDSNGNITHYVAVKEDITARKMMEQELKIAKEQAEKANQIKSEFLANMSHEIRTPMTSIIGMAELLLSENISEIHKKYIHQIYESSTLLLTIINDILDLSKIEAGKLQLENININLKELVFNIIEMFKIKALEKKLDLILQFDEQIPECIKGDPVRLRQIILNLLSNAIKFTEKGFVKLNVLLKETINQKVVILFEVIDSGIGIPKDAISNLFKPFVQVDTSTTRKFGGTGLGLSISKKLVEMMNGEIGVISEINKGSTFWFKIPFDIGEVVKDNTIKEKEVINQLDKALKTINYDEVKLLIVDDNPANRRVIILQLNKLGFKNIDTASDGQEAVEKALKNKYSLILMDCQMNIMDGFEATKIIRTNEKVKQIHTPIIALTADAMSGTRDKCIQAGMDDYIAKPVSINNLQLIINKWL